MNRAISLLFAWTIISVVGGGLVVTDVYGGPKLKMVEVEADSPGQLKKLRRMGLDIAKVAKDPVKWDNGFPVHTYRVKAVVSQGDEKKMGMEGFHWSDVPGKGPQRKIGDEYEVYKSFDAPRNGIRAQLRRIHRSYPKLCQLKTIGYSIQNRPLLAMRLTNEAGKKGKKGKAGRKPQVLFVATHHAREWVATEMAMRFIKYLTANYDTVRRVKKLLDSTEVWVIPVANPDGYQYTFTDERLWRKNLRDNDGDGEITIADGVDLNRNFETRWGLDDEGSSSIFSSGTYRGTGPASEPETEALVKFIEKNDFKFAISYHTYGNLILYPWGWQVKTESLDDPIFVAHAGTDENPAIYDSLTDTGYNPGVGADLYITNGDFTDYTYGKLGIPSHTIEFTNGDDYDFRFPDDEEMVQTVFEDSLEFALSVAESAVDPGHPVSPVGIEVVDLYHTPLSISHGPNQLVEVIARKGVDLKLCVEGNCCSDCFGEELGTYYNNESGTYFSRYVAEIGDQSTGDEVTYTVSGGNTVLGPYTYEVKEASGNPILLVAAEDYTGEYPGYNDTTAPNYLGYYTAALDEGGFHYDIWDVDQQGVPSFVEVLSHYELAVWYSGDDYVPTVPSGLSTHDLENREFREFLNYRDGKLFVTGQDKAYFSAVYNYEEAPDDFYQYYLGAYIDMDTGGVDPESEIPFNVVGEEDDPIFNGMEFNLSGGDGAGNQSTPSTFLSTNYFLSHYDGKIAARYDRPGGPTSPYSGEYYVYSQMSDMSYKRLGGIFLIEGGSPMLSFSISYDIELDWDYAFVEIRPVDTDIWTTLPDINGLTTTSTGDSCVEGWVEDIHPFLAHYMDDGCNPSGTSGQWYGFTGNSGGWNQVEIDLSAYAGQTVELYISYASDWASQNLGIFVDDIEISGYSIVDFETGSGDWMVAEPPEGSDAFNNWERMTGAGLPEGPVVRTENTVYFGFGFEAIDTADSRNAVMKNVLHYLGQ